MSTRQARTPVAEIVLACLGVFVGVVAWWALLYWTTFLVSTITEEVWWSRLGVAIVNVGTIVGTAVIAARERSARAFLIGMLLGLVGFWVLVLGLRMSS